MKQLKEDRRGCRMKTNKLVFERTRFFFGVAQAQKKDFKWEILWVCRGSTFAEQVLLFYAQNVCCNECKWINTNLGLRGRAKFTSHTKQWDSLFQIYFPFIPQHFQPNNLIALIKFKSFVKSEAWKRLSFVCNNYKAFRTKKKKWQCAIWDAWMKYLSDLLLEWHDSRNRWKAQQKKIITFSFKFLLQEISVNWNLRIN